MYYEIVPTRQMPVAPVAGCMSCGMGSEENLPSDMLTLGVAATAGILGFLGILPVIKGGVLGGVIGAALGYGGMVIYDQLSNPKAVL